MSYTHGLRARSYFHYRNFPIWIMATFILVVLAQLLYPANWKLPFSTVGGIPVGLKSHGAVEATIKEWIKNTKIPVEVAGYKREAVLEDLGISINLSTISGSSKKYGVAERLIPFSLFANGFFDHEELPIEFDEQRLHAFTEQLEIESKDSTGPMLYIDDGHVVIENGAGIHYDKQEIIDKLKVNGITGAALKLNGEAVKVDSGSELQSIAQKAQQMIDTPLTVRANDKVIAITPAMIGGWIKFTQKAGNAYILEFDEDSLMADLQDFGSSVDSQPKIITISFDKGKQINKESGGNGKAIDYQKAAQKIENHIVTGGKGMLELPMTTLPPIINYAKDYDLAESGLRELLKDIVSTKSGKISVSVDVLDDRGWTASVNGNRSYHPASTYKMYVAYAWLQTIDQGKALWSERISGSRNASQCFDLMIIKSNNECAEGFARKLGGWRQVQRLIDDAKFSGITVYPKFSATADGEAAFLRRLSAGNLMSKESTERLSAAMAAQQYRKGIPAGSPNAKVEDKVGFLNADLHDAAIVTAGDKKYILTILTTGSSWNDIADISRQVHAFLVK